MNDKNFHCKCCMLSVQRGMNNTRYCCKEKDGVISMKKIILKSNTAVLKAKSFHVFIMNSILSFIVLNRRLNMPKTVRYLDERLTRVREEVDRGVEDMIRFVCEC